MTMGNIVGWYGKIKETLGKGRCSQESIYEISSVLDNHKGSGKVYVIVHVKGTSNAFQKSVEELYEKKWLSGFSKEDVAYIGFLYAAEQSGNLPIIDYFSRRKQRITKSVVILAMLFVAFLILSNLTAIKVVEIKVSHFFWLSHGNNFTLDFPAALILFPLTYCFDDVLTEVYGFKISRLIIWGGLVANTIFMLASWAMVYLPPSPLWDSQTGHGQRAYSLIFTGSWQVFIASVVGYFCGEFLNSSILAKLKVITSGKFLFLRVIGSTAVGVAIDSMIFCNIAFWGVLSTNIIWGMIASMYVFKLCYEIVMLPATYALIAFLKKMDKVDYYDFKTKFNPFSISLEE